LWKKDPPTPVFISNRWGKSGTSSQSRIGLDWRALGVKEGDMG